MAIEINRILDEVRLLGCSDLHFTDRIAPVVRLNGTLRTMRSQYPEMDEEEILNIVHQMTNDAQQTSVNNHHDTDFSFTTRSGYRHRVNVYFQKGKPAIAIRLLRNDIPTLEDLGLPPILADFAMRPRGLVLVTGPTGSGKSTTLAGMIDFVNLNKSAHIITVEDPIEYVHDHKRCMVNQREIGDDVPSFALALRAALREDPDVILVGEMRDFETIQAAVTAAETGHLVFSTLHTMGAANTIDRIIDVFPPHQQGQIRVQLASVLECVVSQALLPTEVGGRCAAFEVLVANSAIRNLIREAKSYQIPSMMQTNRKAGMITLDDSLYELFIQRKVSAETALSFAQDYNYLSRKIM
jgi:twitching motility protein PilT